LIELLACLISILEGERLTSYQDSGGKWTIGLGHTGKDVLPGLVITHERAVLLMKQDCKHLLDAVAGLPATLAAALVSFGYNCGIAPMLRAVSDTSEIMKPVHQTDMRGIVLPGLVKRRRLEYALAMAGR
jgi:lysozyme